MFTYKPRITKNACKNILYISVTCMLVFLLLPRVNRQTGLYIIRWNITEDVSCHYRFTDDSLTLLNSSFSPPEKSIFFIETSCRGGLNSRQACAIESAARAHPNRAIHVLFSSPINDLVLKRSCLSKLLSVYNVKLLRIHLIDYARDTPLEDVVSSKRFNKSAWRIEHSSDVLRYLTLYKYGGVYIDTDVIVVKPLDSLAENFAGRESDWAVDAGVLSFSNDILGRKMAKAAIIDLKKKFKPHVWGNNGPGVITRVLKDMCKGKTWNRGCNGFKVYEPAVFYPVYYRKNKIYFQPYAKLPSEIKTYVHHLWNAFTRNYKIPKGSPYDRLAKEHCPVIYNLFGDQFGV